MPTSGGKRGEAGGDPIPFRYVQSREEEERPPIVTYWDHMQMITRRSLSMSVTVRQIDPQCKIADHLSLPQVETIIPAHVIQDALTPCEAWEQHEKKLKIQPMLYWLIAFTVYPQ